MSVQVPSSVLPSGTERSPLLVSRDLATARSAYEVGDATASKRAHSLGTKPEAVKDAQHGSEDHRLVWLFVHIHYFTYLRYSTSGQYIKSAIFGGLDGIVTIFACVAGVQGGNLPARVLMILGFASLIADAISMGIGDGLSTYAETQFARAERIRESWYRSSSAAIAAAAAAAAAAAVTVFVLFVSRTFYTIHVCVRLTRLRAGSATIIWRASSARWWSRTSRKV